MKNVLLAYEREQDLAAVEAVLLARGHRVLKARSGVEALDLIRGETTPDAVVSDVLLPRLDGFALCRRLREDPALLYLPFVLHSFRVEGPKYEAFAAEVGAQRFLPRGSTLEELAAALEETSSGSGTVRMPALVPELLDRREQDRRRVADLEKQVRELEAQRQQLAAAERVARERAEYESRARAEFAAAESVRIRELQVRIRDLETSHRQARESAEAAQKQAEAAQKQAEAVQQQAEAVQRQAAEAAQSAARGAAEEASAEVARLSALESRLAELQTARARAQSAAADAERAFAAQPTPTFIIDAESRLVHAASDSAAALIGIDPSQLRGRPLAEVLPGVAFADESARDAVLDRQRQDGSDARFAVHRLPTSYAGRACWLLTAQDVTEGARLREREAALAREAATLEAAPEACGLVDAEGRLLRANRALLALLGTDAEGLSSLTLHSLVVDDPDNGETGRAATIDGAGVQRESARWRRGESATIDVEIALAPCEGAEGLRVLAVRDVTAARRVAERNERDRLCVGRLLEITQRAHALTESEILERALQLVQELTGSPLACVFLALPDAPNVELAARRGGDEAAEPLATLARWRGAPPQETALYECVGSQRPIVREAMEGTGLLRQAGLPGALARQLVTPMLDGGRLAGALLLADSPRPYDDDDRRHAAHVAEATWRLLRRRRSDAEVVSAMDHMERVMFGAIEALASLAESQDACKLGRSKRVAEYAAGIGVALGLPGHTVRGLRVMGQLVDVGMLQIPRELLWRPGTLAPSEFELVKTHAERGYEVLRAIEFPWPVAEVVRQHHERLDGSGYPQGLRGEEILLEARIVAVADAVEAMLAQRPHRAALSLNACIEELQSQAGRRYDARVVKACVKLLREGQAPVTNTSVQEGETPLGQRIA